MKIHKSNYNKSLFALFIFVLSLITPFSANTSLAQSTGTDHIFNSTNDILYSDPNDSTCTTVGSTNAGVGTGSTGLSGDSNEEKIWNYLIGRGLTANQTAGVMGNISVETAGTFDPGIEEFEANIYGTKGYGIAQWTGSRRTALESAASTAGVPVNDLGFQLDFMYEESQSRTVNITVSRQGFGEYGANEWLTLTQQSSIEKAIVFWHNNFEVSSQSPEAVISSRGGAATAVFDKFASGSESVTWQGGTSTITCPGGSTATTGSAEAQDIISTIKRFAWPYSTVGMSTNSEATAEYQAAAAYHFPGGYGIYTYADCTYFVATVMRDSGADPEFPIGTTAISPYLVNSGKYEVLKNPTINDLQPGDILQHTTAGSSASGSWSGHILFYTGNALDSSGTYVGADASKYTRVPGYLEQRSIDSMLNDPTVVRARIKTNG